MNVYIWTVYFFMYFLSANFSEIVRIIVNVQVTQYSFDSCEINS